MSAADERTITTVSSVFGAVCTYRRPHDLGIMLDAIKAQTRQPDRLVIVDNAADPEIGVLVAAHPISRTIPVEVLEGVGNPGPAGAFALAFERFEPLAHDDDLFVLFDDDDPPRSNTVLADLTSVVAESFVDPSVAGVGLRGGMLDLRTGFVEPRPRVRGSQTETSDHLHGGWFPCYRFSALKAVDDFDPSFFWGFEELELGRRLLAHGFELRVASDLYFTTTSESISSRRRHIFSDLQEPSWRHFYRHRNLIRVLRRDRAWSGLAVMVIGRMFLKPLFFAPRNPRRTIWHLRTNTRAIIDGLRREPLAAKHPHHLPI